MQNIIILGSTGNLGKQCLEILDQHQDKFRLVGITGHSNQELLHQQARKYHIPADSLDTIDLQKADIVINLLAGLVGINPTLKAQELHKKILLANKEALIASPEIDPTNIIPVDSEHNALYEIIKAHPNQEIQTLFLPCSGGPFLGKTAQELQNVTLEEILAHPKYQMGQKISIESATLLNKGFELIEAHRLFNIPLEKIQVFIHPECRVHGAIKFTNGKTYAYISPPDMREHLENALLDKCPADRIKQIPDLGIIEPDHQTFPGIKAVTNAYQNGTIKEFLQKEELLITSLLKGDITWSQLTQELSQS